MKLLLSLFLYFLLFSAHALELKCNFEEVYKDKSTQLGLLLIKDTKLRYQYLDKNLFTIFKKNSDFYYVENRNTETFKKINDNTAVLKNISEIFEKYPNIENIYHQDDLKFLIEKSEETNFLKRISVQSPKVNLSIYFRDCEEIIVQDKYLSFFPFNEYN